MYARLLGCALLCVSTVSAQRVMQTLDPAGMFRPLPSDSFVLGSGESRRDLPCKVIPIKPEVGFDFRFHSGYDVKVPLSELATYGDVLTIILRVTADSPKSDPVYLVQRVGVPPFEVGSTGMMPLNGSFEVGEGKYKVDWLMRNQAEHFCSSYWEFSAFLPLRQMRFALNLSPGAVDESQDLSEVPSIEEPGRPGLVDARILLNCAAEYGGAVKLGPDNIKRMLSIVRHIGRESRIRKLSIIAFSLQQQEVVWKQDDALPIDFRALRLALDSLNTGIVDIKRLSQRGREADFLMSLISQVSKNGGADVLIFVGPRVDSGFGVPKDMLKELRRLSCPVFYLNYDLVADDGMDMRSYPWHDAIGSIVKHWHGQQFTITTPRDLFWGWSQIISVATNLKSLASGSHLPQPTPN